MPELDGETLYKMYAAVAAGGMDPWGVFDETFQDDWNRLAKALNSYYRKKYVEEK